MEICSYSARQRQAQRRSEKILSAALTLFCTKGIEDTSIEDVARQAGVGPATVYRYYDTKAELAIQSAVFYWKTTADKYIEKLNRSSYKNACGYKQLSCILDIFMEIFREEFSFLRFLYEFDVFVQKYCIHRERLNEYEDAILNVKPFVTDALKRGLEDGTLDLFGMTIDEAYFSVTHTMLSLMQKLAANGQILESDDRVAAHRQVEIAAALLLRGLSPR